MHWAACLSKGHQERTLNKSMLSIQKKWKGKNNYTYINRF